MGKAKMLGMNKMFVPNSKMDMRFKKKIYQRGREVAERDLFAPKQGKGQERSDKRKEGCV